MKIIQITESLMYGDGIGNDVIQIDSFLKESNITTFIYVCNINNIYKGYANISAPISNICSFDKDDIILFHHGISNEFIYKLRDIKCKKILVYHNVTPSKFFKFCDIGLANACEAAIKQVKDCKDVFDFCIVCSEFSKNDLISYGYKCPIYICPNLVDYGKLQKEKLNKKILNKYNDDWTNILFVGRLSVHKKQDDIIHSYALYKKIYNKKTRLFLVGSGSDDYYGRDLKKYCIKYNIDDVIFVGKVNDSDLATYYSISNLFLCMSEHEGFCIPIVEAMFFKLPIIAYNSSAISFTLKGTGILIENKDFFNIAKNINKIIQDNSYRKSIIDAEIVRSKYFELNNVRRIFFDIIMGKCLDNKNIFTNNDFDVVIPVKYSDFPIFKKNLYYIEKNFNPKNIIVITNTKKNIDFETNYGNISIIDENSLVDGLTFDNVKKCLNKMHIDKVFHGQWFQQFLKLSYARVCKNEYYLTWDADTIPLNNFKFFENNKPIFSLKKEYIKPYFDTIKRILNLDKIRKESFICEHMMFKREFVLEILNELESNSKLKGKYFWEKIVLNSPKNSFQNPYFSEFETYGTFVETKHHNFYAFRKLRTLRCAKDFVGDRPSDEVLKWVKQDFDLISIEHFAGIISKSVALAENYVIRSNFTFLEFIKYELTNIKMLACLGNKKYLDIYNDLKNRIIFDDVFLD